MPACAECHGEEELQRLRRGLCPTCYWRQWYTPHPRKVDSLGRWRRVAAARELRMAGYPVSYVARQLDVSIRTVGRYLRDSGMGMNGWEHHGEKFPPIPDAPPDVGDETEALMAFHIAAHSDSAEALWEMAECLEIPRQAFVKARADLRWYTAPAAELFTVLHIPVVVAGVLVETKCGRTCTAQGLWQRLERTDGDKVCPGCEGRDETPEPLF